MFIRDSFLPQSSLKQGNFVEETILCRRDFHASLFRFIFLVWRIFFDKIQRWKSLIWGFKSRLSIITSCPCIRWSPVNTCIEADYFNICWPRLLRSRVFKNRYSKLSFYASGDLFLVISIATSSIVEDKLILCPKTIKLIRRAEVLDL